MLTPIEIFQKEGKLEDPDKLFSAAQANLNEDLGDNQKKRAFLLTQATLLCKNGCKALVLTQELSKGGVGVYDREIQKLSITSEPTASMSSTLSHEMTHGIEHLFSHNSEEKVMNMLQDASEDMAQIITLASEALPLDMQGPFRRQIYDDRSKTNIQKLSEELGAYMVEGFFNDIHSHPDTKRKNFIDRYNSLLEPKGKDKRRGFTEEEEKLRKKVQGLIAVSMFEANQVILENLPESSSTLKAELENIQSALQPAYNMATTQHMWKEKDTTITESSLQAQSSTATMTSPAPTPINTSDMPSSSKAVSSSDEKHHDDRIKPSQPTKSKKRTNPATAHTSSSEDKAKKQKPTQLQQEARDIASSALSHMQTTTPQSHSTPSSQSLTTTSPTLSPRSGPTTRSQGSRKK